MASCAVGALLVTSPALAHPLEIVPSDDRIYQDLARLTALGLTPMWATTARPLTRLEIARLVAAGPNVLLLDEPTNYISLDVLEAFEAGILHFPGPVIAVSHDRWFIQRFGGEIWDLVDGKLVQA